jgi:hypothetical protein
MRMTLLQQSREGLATYHCLENLFECREPGDTTLSSTNDGERDPADFIWKLMTINERVVIQMGWRKELPNASLILMPSRSFTAVVK